MFNRLALMVPLFILAGSNLSAADTSPNPMGVNWGATYGIGTPRETFMPQVRQLGASFSRILLYWSQLEPKPGVPRWSDLDAYTSQISTPEEGILTLMSASPWATRTKTWVFPSSPATDANQYSEFISHVVEHVKGKIRYFQSDNEPSNPFFWSGIPEEFAAQQKLFYRAVKKADPSAIVVLGGCDGLFDPTGEDPFPNQEAGLAFWKKVLASAGDSYDLFDLHLYGNPYSIPERVEFWRGLMRKAGSEKPIIAAEYYGPGFFEFKANRRWWSVLQGPAASEDAVRQLREQAATLPFETQMFLASTESPSGERLIRLQSADLVVRNVLALSSGVRRTAFFDLWHDSAKVDKPNTVLDGKFKLLERDENKALAKELPLAVAFRRLSTALAGETRMTRIALVGHEDVFAFQADRAKRKPLLIVWRRPPTLADTLEPLRIEVPWKYNATYATTAEGNAIEFSRKHNFLSMPVTDVPVLLE